MEQGCPRCQALTSNLCMAEAPESVPICYRHPSTPVSSRSARSIAGPPSEALRCSDPTQTWRSHGRFSKRIRVCGVCSTRPLCT